MTPEACEGALQAVRQTSSAPECALSLYGWHHLQMPRWKLSARALPRKSGGTPHFGTL